MARITQQASVTIAPSGSTGTQANEFEAAIKSVTSATTVGAVFVYDTRNDSDGGAWRKKCQGLSWFDETLNTATRGGRRSFPSVALIVGDNPDSGNKTVTIYDLDDPAMPMWMVFNCDTAAWASNATFVSCAVTGNNSNDITSVYALNGRLFVGGAANGLVEIDFTTEQQTNYRPDISATAVLRHKKSGRIADRNDTSGQVLVAGTPIVNASVNDVAATIVEGSELGALGLPIPTVAVACGPSGSAGGVSIIHPNGDVFTKTTTVVSVTKCEFTKSGLAISQNDYIVRFANSELYANGSGSYPSSFVNNGTIQIIRQNGTAPSPNLLDTTNNDEGFVCTGGDDFASGSPDGLSLLKWNNGNPQEGAVAYITSTYNTGYMLGDIRLSTNPPTVSTWTYYSNGDAVQDRSVKANHLTTVGQVDIGAVATSAELFAFSGFSASNFLSRSNDTDFDFGTGDFSVMLWVKDSNTNAVKDYVTRVGVSSSDATKAAGNWSLLKTNKTIELWRYSGSAWEKQVESAADAFPTSQWTQVILSKKGGNYQIYLNGKKSGNQTSNSNSFTTTAGLFTIGMRVDANTQAADTASISLVRLSATAPTPTQVADIYRQEAPLFRSGAKCLLSQVSFNDVNDLAYDNSSDLLYVGTKSGDAGDSVSTFRGLERVDTKDGQDLGWDGASANLLAAAGGVVGYARTSGNGGVVVDLPPFDVRGDTNIADSKLPDDGKIHFSAAIDDSNPTTPTVIGVLPMAEGETYYITARVFCRKYRDTSAAARASYVIEQKFRRPIGGNATAATPMSVLRDEGTASMDAVFSADTGSQQIRLTVTGVANTRSIWSAELDVERISEKQYER